MAENWDDTPSFSSANAVKTSSDWDDVSSAQTGQYNAARTFKPQGSSTGRSFGKGRGFLSKSNGYRRNELDEGNDRNSDAKQSFYGTDDNYGARKDNNNEGYRNNYKKPYLRQERNSEEDNDNRSFGRRDRFNKRDNNDNDDTSDAGKSKQGDGDVADKKPPVTYVPPEISALSLDDVVRSGDFFADYDKIEVRCSVNNVPKPMLSFRHADFVPDFYRNISDLYSNPTPVQKHAIPCIMQGRDVMGCSQTGSGKTAAFLFPIIDKLLKLGEPQVVCDRRHTEPYVLVVAPTRELVTQIASAAYTFLRGTQLKVGVLYGGTAVFSQRERITECHILVATVGRLIDFMEKGYVSFPSIKFVVLDEADRMLDMGFRNEIDRIMNHQTMPSDKQILMFSATFSDEIQRLAANYLNDYIFISAGVTGAACKDIEQIFYQVDKKQKCGKFQEILKQEEPKGILVFVETKKTADFLAVLLSSRNYPATSIHGDRVQDQREEALADFKRGKASILVATNVAARGIDLNNVKHVINYDLPKEIDDYVHRIGRTGRLGNYGKATSFYDSSRDSALVSDLVRILKQANQKVPEFLENGGNMGFGVSDDGFGGHDYRGQSHQQESYQQQPSSSAVVDEDW